MMWGFRLCKSVWGAQINVHLWMDACGGAVPGFLFLSHGRFDLALDSSGSLIEFSPDACLERIEPERTIPRILASTDSVIARLIERKRDCKRTKQQSAYKQ